MTTVADEIATWSNKVYLAINTVEGGWTKGLDSKMDEEFQKFNQ